jgi:hypothetical protein
LDKQQNLIIFGQGELSMILPEPEPKRGDVIAPEQMGTNQESFSEYDMVVSISQKTINDQLQKLVAHGVIRPTLILAQQTDAKGNFIYQMLDSPAAIPKGAAFINAMVLPEIAIPASGTLVTLVLRFTAGTAAFWSGVGPLAQLNTYDMTGWSYGITVTLDLKAVAAGDLAHGVPDLVRAQLTNFTSRMFNVSRLFLDLASTDLLRFDTQTTNADVTGESGIKQLALFMQFYLRSMVDSGNPFVLGYSITTNDNSQITDDLRNVPDLLKATGTTFTLYHEPSDPNLSNLNFVLVTKGGHKTIAGTPRNFAANWLLPEKCDGKVTYSGRCLTEPMLVQPVFEQLRQTVYAQISSNINVAEGNDYSAARMETGNGWSFNISNVASGDDQYVNQFTVTLANGPGTVQIVFHGGIHAYKEVSKDAFFCTARAWASGDILWGGTITLAVTNGVLTIGTHFQTDSSNNHSDTNSCADAFSWIGKIIGGVLDVFTGFTDGFYFSNLVSSAFSVNIPGIGNVSVALQTLTNSVRSLIMLPAGGVFDFHNPTADGHGNLSLQLTYRT